MRVYKPSGIEWLGEIPKHWEIKKIKTIFNIGRGRVISQQELEEMGNYPVYSSQTKNNGILGYIQTYDFDCTQITWTTDGVNAGTIFLRSGKHNCTNVCGTLRPKQDENMSFLSYAIKIATPHYKRPDTNGAKIMNNEMANIEIVYPPLQEQKEIAEFLDSKCEKIQNYIDKKQKLITLLQEKKQALINEAVTKGLNPNIESKNSGIEYLGLIPHHWEVVKVKYIATTNIGLVYDPSEIATNENVGYPVLRANNIQNGKIDYKDVIYVAKKIDDKQLAISGDLLMCVRNGSENLLGKTAKIENNNFSFGAFTAIIRSDLNNYLYWIFQTEMLKKSISSFIVSIGIGQISQDDIKNFKIPLPPLQEQKEIAEFLDKKCEKINSAIEKTKKQIELVKEYKNTLINEAVCGRINLERK